MTKKSNEKITGSSASYYKFPENALQLQDLIEHRNMNFSIGNIFKACYRLGNKETQDEIYDIDKIIWYAIREKSRMTGQSMEDIVEKINLDYMQG